MKKVYFSNLIIVIIGVSLLNCSSDSTDDLTPPTEPITYSNEIKSIMDNHCTNCHSDPPINGAPNALTTYDEVRLATEEGVLLERVELAPGSPGVMPPFGSTLTSTQINFIKEWMENGYIE